MQPAASRALLAVAWVSSLLVVHWLSRAPSSSPQPGTHAAASGARPGAAPGRLAVNDTDRAAPAGSRIAALVERRNATPATTGSGVPSAGLVPSARRAREVLSENDPIERTAAYIDLLRGIDRHNAPELLEAFADGGYGYDRSREYALFLYAWGQVDGTAAAAHLQDKPGSGWDKLRDMQSVLSGWATREPEAALSWAREHGRGEENPYLIGVISGMAKSDLARAAQVAETLPYGRVRGQVADLLVEGHLQKGDGAAMDWAASIADERLREGVVRRVALKVGEHDPALAADWALGVAHPEARPALVENVVETWARRDPPAAAAWVDAQRDADVRLQAVSELAGEWARRDAAKAGEWVAAQPEGALRDQAIESYARGIRRSDPATAMRWAGSVQDTEKRRALLERLMADWQERDPEGAQAFLGGAR